MGQCTAGRRPPWYRCRRDKHAVFLQRHKCRPHQYLRCLRDDPLRARVDRPPASSWVGRPLILQRNTSHDTGTCLGSRPQREPCHFLGWSPASSRVGRPSCVDITRLPLGPKAQNGKAWPRQTGPGPGPSPGPGPGTGSDPSQGPGPGYVSIYIHMSFNY